MEGQHSTKVFHASSSLAEKTKCPYSEPEHHVSFRPISSRFDSCWGHQMIKSKHIVDYCSARERQIVRCGTCDNNCCNGGYGEISGATCPDCPEAYDMDELLWKKSEVTN